jgi:hypothetical protein
LIFKLFSFEAGVDDAGWVAAVEADPAVVADGDGALAVLFPHAVMNISKADKTNNTIDLLDIFILVFLPIFLFGKYVNQAGKQAVIRPTSRSNQASSSFSLIVVKMPSRSTACPSTNTLVVSHPDAQKTSSA